MKARKPAKLAFIFVFCWVRSETIVDNLLLILGIVAAIPLSAVLFMAAFLGWCVYRFLGNIVRIFEEKPLFIIPKGLPIPGAEDVRFATADGLQLSGCYVRTSEPVRRGVVLYGTEFGSNRWSCGAYCKRLLESGFDVFSFEFRNQGESQPMPGYEPLQWVTEYELADMRAALAYLKQRPDADPRGIGVFGVSRGGGTGVFLAAEDPYIRCVVTDGAFATRTTMIPYMRKWSEIYIVSWLRWAVPFIPRFAFALIAQLTLSKVEKKRNCRFPSMERAIRKLAPRPLFMIHGGLDTYIKPPIAERLFSLAREPKTFWLVDKARHNQALHVAGEEYQRRLVEFFNRHLAPAPAHPPKLQPVNS